MKIAILIDSLKSGGAQKQSAILAKGLSKYHKIVYIVFDEKEARASFLEILNQGQNIKIIYLNAGKIKTIFEVIRIFKNEKPDFSFSYLPFGNFVNGIAGKISGVVNNIGGIRNSEVERYKLIFEKLSHNFFLKSSISNSIAGAHWHKDKGFKKEIYCIGNSFPIDTEKLERRNSDVVSIVSVGRFVDQKNYPLAIAAFQKCLNILSAEKEAVSVRYSIIGYGELEEELRTLISNQKLDEYIEIIINPLNMMDYYKAADIYLCTSKFEGMSNSIMEAMSFSLPIVATNVGGNAELVHDKKNGLLVEQNLDEISQALLNLIKSSNTRSVYGSHSYDIIKTEFSEEAFLNKYESIIKLG